MPPPRPITSLVDLCTTSLAHHFTNVFSSWHKCNENQDCAGVAKQNSRFVSFSNVCGKDILEHASNVNQNSKCSQKFEKYENKEIINNAIGDTLVKELSSAYEDYDEIPSTRTKKSSNVAPFLNQDTIRLPIQLKNILICQLPSPIMEILLQAVINQISNEVQIPNPAREVRDYTEDLSFMVNLAIMLKLSLTCFLTQGVKSLDLSTLSHLIRSWKILWMSYEGQNAEKKIEHPNLDIFSYAFDDSLPGMRTLKYLKQPHFVCDNFIRKVGFLCPNLEVLILACSDECTGTWLIERDGFVTDISALYGCSSGQGVEREMEKPSGCLSLISLTLPLNIKILDLDYQVFNLLSSMTNLQHLVGAPMVKVHRYMDDLQDQLVLSSKLTNFCHSVSLFEEEGASEILEGEVSKLTSRFPNVKEVWINSGYKDAGMILKSFPKAETVSIYFHYLPKYCISVLPSNIASLSNLRSLDIASVSDSMPFLIALSHNCPKLEHLNLEESNSLFLYEPVTTVIKFPYLRTLGLKGLTEVAREALLTLLRGCPVISSLELSITCTDHMNNEFDQSTLNQILPWLHTINRFSYDGKIIGLECEDILSQTLELDSLHSLISSCPHLTYVGQMDSWNVTKEEVEAVREEARVNNWDLEIV